MLSLTHLFLHNWHRFSSQLIDVTDGLCLTGPDGADAQAVMDAIQFALLGDPARVQFAPSRLGFAQDVESYARGRMGEDRWLRTGNAVSYVILEFTETLDGGKTTCGLCIETGPRRATEYAWFILPDALNPKSFVTTGRPLPRLELRALLRNWRGARHFERAHDYQTELLGRLGGLDDRFLNLLQRAMHFEPLPRLDDFLAEWLLPPAPLDLTPLRRARERLGQLRPEAERLEKRLNALSPLLKSQNEVKRLTALRDGQTVLAALLRANAATRNVEAIQRHIAGLQEGLAATQQEMEIARAKVAETEARVREAERLEFEDGQGRRRDNLNWQLKHTTHLADSIRDHRTALGRDLNAAADGLRPLLPKPDLGPEEQFTLRELLEGIAAANRTGLTPALGPLVEAAATKLETATTRIGGTRVRLMDQIAELRRQADSLSREEEQLKTQAWPSLPPGVARMQELLTPLIGKKPPLLYEFIEVPDARWQNAVEAMLGPLRFHTIVSATWYEAARRALDEARAEVGEAGLHDPTRQYVTPPQPGSLAEKVKTIYPDLRMYVDALLGDVMTCETVEELSRYPRAITPGVIVQSGWSAHFVPPTQYQPVVIGKNAERLRKESRDRELAEVREKLSEFNRKGAELTAQLEHTETVLGHLRHAARLPALRERLNAPLDDADYRGEIAALEAALRGLDMTTAAQFVEQAKGLRLELAGLNRARDDLSHKIVSLELDLRARHNELAAAKTDSADREREAAEARAKFANVLAGAEDALAGSLKQADLAEAIREAERKERDFDSRVREERQRLTDAATSFNVSFQFVAQPSDPHEERYAQLHARLAETELPRCREQIASSEQDIDEELRDHVLRSLRERLAEAGQALTAMNDTLAGLSMDGRTYRFTAESAPDMGSLIALIADDDPSSETLSQLYETLTGPNLDERLVDYRRYLSYAIEIKDVDGAMSRLNPADPDTQAAFYLTIAASFVQAYRIRAGRGAAFGREGRPAIRLAPFAAAFAKMDTDQIGPTLDLFQRLGLQVVAATPLERCDYLVPKLATTAVLTSVGNTTLVEPYRNFAAQVVGSY
jgi:hypothetical protein